MPAHHLVHAPVERIAGAPHFSRAGDEEILPAHLGERLAGAISWHGPGRFGPGPRIIAGAPWSRCAGNNLAVISATNQPTHSHTHYTPLLHTNPSLLPTQLIFAHFYPQFHQFDQTKSKFLSKSSLPTCISHIPLCRSRSTIPH